MIILKQAERLVQFIENQKEMLKTIGFVPTMGALHAGHIDLICQSKQHTQLTVCSIFVNPTQFNDPADYRQYPATIEKDIQQLEAAAADVLFLPEVREMYPRGTTQLEHYDLGYLETVLEGQYRPGHFQGVCQVMNRLLSMVQPHKLFMGQKDYQQCMVVKRLLQLMHSPVELLPCPTVREADGLAMSSRNMRLPATDRAKAGTIYQSLQLIGQHLAPGPLQAIKAKAQQLLQEKGFRVDYVATAKANTLALTDDWDGQEPLVALVAAFLGEVRLIDNLLLNTTAGMNK